MAGPQLSKNWTITPNVRRAFVSLNDLAAWCMYQNKAALLAAGWTVKFSSDGVTGPANAADTTDRWPTQAGATVRAAVAAAPQSWIVLQNADGVQLRIAYAGASDDIFDIAFSPISGFTLAGTTTHQPGAADGTSISTANSIVNATASNDRVMSIWTTSDTRHWMFAIYRQSVGLNYIGLERINNMCGPGVFGNGVTDMPYVGFRHGTGIRSATFGAGAGPIGDGSNLAVGAAGWYGTVAKVFTGGALRNVRAGAGTIQTSGTADASNWGASAVFTNQYPALQGGGSSPMFPPIWSGELGANTDGFLGYPIDWWVMYTNALSVPAHGDFVPGYDPADVVGVTPIRSNWLVSLGAAFVRPWRNAAATLEIT